MRLSKAPLVGAFVFDVDDVGGPPIVERFGAEDDRVATLGVAALAEERDRASRRAEAAAAVVVHLPTAQDQSRGFSTRREQSPSRHAVEVQTYVPQSAR